MLQFISKIFGGSKSEKDVKKIAHLVPIINGHFVSYQELSNDALRGKTTELKARITAHLAAIDQTIKEEQANAEALPMSEFMGRDTIYQNIDELKKERNKALETILMDLLPEAFAVVKEVARRFTNNTELVATATELDRQFSVTKEYVSIKGEQSVFQSTWKAAGVPITWNMVHYDVQLIGGIVLHEGKIAEMSTGEGKTLVSTLPAYLNALSGEGVHIVTVNDYLAKRDSEWNGTLFEWLGLTVDCIDKHQPNSEERRDAYRADITYGTNNEFGFDYLRDNMVTDLSQMVMRPGHEMNYALVDEVDSILIDEARTPLIISAAAEEATDQYYRFAELVRGLKETDDYNVDEKMHSSTLTEAGITKFEQWLGIANIYEEGGIKIVHHIEQALKAEVLFRRDRDYIVDNGEVIIIDEFTGRKMPGRRYSEGLHQALEAKEKLSIQKESQTLATITFQNLFRMYRKLGGMTGTAATEAEELFKIYHLEVVTIPTNRLDHRTDLGDRIYKLEEGKFAAIAELVKERRANNQPVLIGTISVEKNERLSSFLTAKGIQHEILNAKNHEREGEIIAQAGRPGAVTLATNMAGRGVDIKLGGVPANPQDLETVVKAGGLFVLGTERHESRRIDNQLRGRAARQGDPGETQFFVSTEDELMRIFGGDRLKGVMTRLNVPDDMPIEQKMISRVLENAQKKVEAHHFDTRKNLLEYDDVLNKQRTVIYQKRRAILEAALKTEENILEKILQEYLDHEIEAVVATHTNTVGEGDWDVKEIYETVQTIFPTNEADQKELMDIAAARAADNFGDVEAREKISAYLVIRTREAESNIKKAVHDQFSNNEEAVNLIREVQKGILIRAIDTLWVDHLVAIDYLRSGIGLQGYGQRDPLVEYKRQSFQMFNQLLSDIQKEIVYSYFKVGVGVQLAPSIMDSETIKLSGPSDGASSDQIIEGKVLELNSEGSNEVGSPRVEAGRNEPCPCGLGKKFKKCHGA